VFVSRVYGYRAETVDEPVGKVHNSYRDALLDARAYNRTLSEKSPSADVSA
jgi:hypothetical protein